MLNVPFQAVDLHVFDVHTTVRPLGAPGYLQPKFQFLADANLYRQQYATKTSILTKSLDVHPLSNHAQTKNHFWQNYLNRPSTSGAFDSWALQTPFLGSLRRSTLGLSKSLSFQGRITPVVYLSGLGWSTSLNIHLRGNIQLSALLNFIMGMIGTKPSPALELNGQPAKLSIIFSNVAATLLDEVYDPVNKPTTGSPEISRHTIISLSKFGGSPVHYRRTGSAPGMNTAEQALLHSLLRGEVIGARDLAAKLRKPAPTIVDFGSGPDFMLLYFDYGALLFLQQSAARNDRHQRALSCVAANMRSSAIMIWTLYYFYRTTLQDSNKAVKEMRALVEANLLAMKDKYLSSGGTVRGSVKYAKAVFQNHDALKRL